MLRRAILPPVGVVLGYVVVAVAFSWPLPLHLSSTFTGDPGGDTGVYVWNQWVFQDEALVRRANPLTTDKIFSLTPRADLTQHNYTAFLDLLALPLIPWLGVVTTFNVVYLTISVLTALMTYLLVRRVTQADRAQAWLAGLLFAWSPALVARGTGHFSLVAAAPIPAFIYSLVMADRSRQLRYAALTGVCMAWAAFCDVYYAVYCLMIAAGYVISRVVRVTSVHGTTRTPWRWVIEVLIVSVAGLVAGLLLGRGGRLDVFGFAISIHGLYTPMFVLTMLAVARLLLVVRPHIVVPSWRPSPAAWRAMLVGVLACVGPLAPVLYGLSQRIADGRFASPPIFWRSSPRGIDLLGLFEPNPNHVLVRSVREAVPPVVFVEYTAALSLVALAVIALAVWRTGYRPRAGWIWLAAGFAALSLGPFVYVAGINTYIPGPWALLRYLPLVGEARTPTRFAVVAALGLAVLFAGALVALGRQHPRRRLVTTIVGAALVFELFPGPRTLYSADIPSLYKTIAADPRPVRIMELPFGVRDGVSSVGNFSARYQYFQTLHGKRLIGGYLSRVSRKRVDAVRAQPTLDALLTLSEGHDLTPEHAARIRARAPGFLARSNLGYVVINHARAPKVLVDFVVDAWGLEEIARDGQRVLYRPTVGSRGQP